MTLSLISSSKTFLFLLSTLGSSPFSFFNTRLFLAILLDTWKNSSISLRVQLSGTKVWSFAFSYVFAEVTFSFIKTISPSKSSAFLQKTTFSFLRIIFNDQNWRKSIFHHCIHLIQFSFSITNPAPFTHML